MQSARNSWGVARLALGVAILIGFVFSGCDKKPDGSASAGGSSTNGSSATASAGGLTKVRVGYIGLTCEAPIFIAYEKGFFKEEGIDAELTKFDWATYRDALGLGKYDITHHLVMYLLKPIEQGADIKILAGIHRGCLRVQSAQGGSVKTIADLKDKRIGVPALGTPPHAFATRVVANNGMDPNKDVTWRPFPATELGLALDKGEVDAIATADPIGSLLMSQGKVQNVCDMAEDAPYKDEYCCVVAANGKFLSANPKAAAGATRALLKAAKWVQTNPTTAAQISVDKKYVSVKVELDALAISKLKYLPSVSGGHDAIITAARDMKVAGLLNTSTDLAALENKAWQTLDGVSDDWLNTLKVEQVAGGNIIPPLDKAQMASYLTQAGKGSCCVGK